jgi:hypothetical protein
MTRLYTFLEHAPPADRLARIIAGLRVIGGSGFGLLGMYLVIQDAYLEAILSVVTILAWVAVTTEAMNLLLERSWRVTTNERATDASGTII